jgi:hypothetical protein
MAAGMNTSIHDAGTIVAQTMALEQQASEHKRAIGQHRRKLQAAMAALQELRQKCHELGIDVIHVQRDSSH